jgi:hypothetical protein
MSQTKIGELKSGDSPDTQGAGTPANWAERSAQDAYARTPPAKKQTEPGQKLGLENVFALDLDLREFLTKLENVLTVQNPVADSSATVKIGPQALTLGDSVESNVLDAVDARQKDHESTARQIENVTACGLSKLEPEHLNEVLMAVASEYHSGAGIRFITAYDKNGNKMMDLDKPVNKVDFSFNGTHVVFDIEHGAQICSQLQKTGGSSNSK